MSRLADVMAALAAYNIDDSHIQVQLALGRGLHYYTDVVFELYDASGQSQLCGGGRYNELVQSLGGRKSIPAVGFAFGLERLRLRIGASRARPAAPPQTQVLVAAVSPERRPRRHAGRPVAPRARHPRGARPAAARRPRADASYANRRQCLISCWLSKSRQRWIPAFAGMTVRRPLPSAGSQTVPSKRCR